MKVSVIIPVFNEKGTISEIIEKVRRTDIGKIEKEIIIVDDKSTDGTRDLLKIVASNQLAPQSSKSEAGCPVSSKPANQLTSEPENQIKVIYHEKNKGKGAAIRTGFAVSTGDIVMIQDADLELNPEEQPVLLKPIIEGKTKVVFGSRFLSRVEGINSLTFLANKLFTFLTNLLYGVHITDVMTCYKVMTREVLEKLVLRSDKFDIEPELAAKICKVGYAILEVPITYNPRKFKSGKKIRFSDSFSVIWALIKYRFMD